MRAFLSFFRDSMTDMLQTSGISHTLLKALFFLLASPPIFLFSLIIMRYNHLIGAESLALASRWLLKKFYRGFELAGDSPTKGPTLFLCHHPGIVDSLILFCSIGRADLVPVVNDRYFFRALTSLGKEFIFVDQSRPGMAVIKRMLSALREGKALVLYPGGKIETDPALCEFGAPFLEEWSSSPLLLQRLAAKEGWEFQVQSVIVQGIFAPEDLDLPWVRAGEDQRARETRAIFPIIFGGLAKKRSPRIWYSPPARAQEVLQATAGFPDTYQREITNSFWMESRGKGE
jgi:hypothetical protein